jgi:hypothetical protein
MPLPSIMSFSLRFVKFCTMSIDTLTGHKLVFLTGLQGLRPHTPTPVDELTQYSNPI